MTTDIAPVGVADGRRADLSEVDRADRLNDLSTMELLLRQLHAAAPDDISLAIRLGFVLRQNGRYPEACAIHAKALRAVPDHRAVRFAYIDSVVCRAIHERDWGALERAWNPILESAGYQAVSAGDAPGLPISLIRTSVGAGRIHYAFGDVPLDSGPLPLPRYRSEINAMRAFRYSVFWKLMAVAIDRPFTVLFDAGDGRADATSVPRVAFSVRGDGEFAIPDYNYVHSGAYGGFLKALVDVPWRDRKSAALWRGAPNGTKPESGRWQDLPRVRLCVLAADSGGRVDAGLHRLSGIDAYESGAREGMARLLRPAVPAADHSQWRRQIDIDGITNGWPGLFQRLASGSPVLKVVSAGGWRQWYYDRLVPWGNFVPVASDLSDLLDKADWLARHDEEAHGIGRSGAALARSLTWNEVMREAAPVVAAADRALRAAEG